MAGIADMFGFLFGSSDSKDPDNEIIKIAIEAIVDQVEPRVRMDTGYQRKLTGSVRHTLAYLRAFRDELPQEPLTLARAQWSRDPRLNAFFATADDVPAVIGKSRELRALFQKAPPEVTEATAMLGMKLTERQVLGPKLVGSELHHDVAQTSVSFSMHRLFGPALTLLETRREVGRRLFLRLAQVALKRIMEADNLAADLSQRKGYLATRLRLLNLAKDGIEGIVDDPASIAEQIRSVESELKGTVDQFIEVKSSVATLDRYIDQINDVLDHPEAHLKLVRTPLRVSRLGIKVEAGEDPNANELVLDQLQFADISVVVATVSIPRAEMPPAEDLVAKAERYL